MFRFFLFFLLLFPFFSNADLIRVIGFSGTNPYKDSFTVVSLPVARGNPDSLVPLSIDSVYESNSLLLWDDLNSATFKVTMLDSNEIPFFADANPNCSFPSNYCVFYLTVRDFPLFDYLKIIFEPYTCPPDTNFIEEYRSCVPPPVCDGDYSCLSYSIANLSSDSYYVNSFLYTDGYNFSFGEVDFESGALLIPSSLEFAYYCGLSHGGFSGLDSSVNIYTNPRSCSRLADIYCLKKYDVYSHNINFQLGGFGKPEHGYLASWNDEYHCSGRNSDGITYPDDPIDENPDDPNPNPSDPLDDCVPTDEDDCSISANPDVENAASFYTSSYPEGLSGIWDTRYSELESSDFVSWLDTFNFETSGYYSFPNMCFNFGEFADFGCKELSMPEGVMTFVRLCLLFLASIVSRRLIFGG